MKVLFISSGNALNGISPIVKNQAESLIKNGIIVDHFTVKGKGLRAYLNHIFILKRYIQNNSYDLYHAHYSLSSYVAALAGCNPLVVSLMGSDTQSGFFAKFLIRIFSIIFWKELIIKSASMKKKVGISKARIIPNGVDLDIIKPETITSKPKKINILFASDPKRKSKNYPLAVAAINYLNDPQIHLNIVYGVDHNEIIKQIKQANIVILTSLWEGSPNIIKEAMACNRPAVSTNVGDVKWLFGDEPGYYITTFDPGDVAAKILTAIEFLKVHDRTNGRARIQSLGLDSDSIAGEIINVYYKAC